MKFLSLLPLQILVHESINYLLAFSYLRLQHLSLICLHIYGSEMPVNASQFFASQSHLSISDIYEHHHHLISKKNIPFALVTGGLQQQDLWNSRGSQNRTKWLSFTVT